MIRVEQEVTLVLNAADCDEDFLSASSTWRRWTRFLDRPVSESLATCPDIRVTGRWVRIGDNSGSEPKPSPSCPGADS